MAIKPELEEYVRTFLLGDNEANDRIEAQLDEQGWDGFGRLLFTLFFLAVERKFGEEVDPPEIIRFVAELRIGLHGGPEVNAEDAEALITSTIDPSIDYDIAPEQVGRIQAAAVHQVFGEGRVSPEEIDEVLAQAVTLASREVDLTEDAGA